MKKKISIVILAIVFMASSIFLVADIVKRNNETKELERIQSAVSESEITKDDSTESSTSETIKSAEQKETEVENTEVKISEEILPEFSSLYEENSDMCGWLKINSTPIDYPVMYTPKEPNFYLHRDWNKEESTHGLIYIDERCDLENSDNLIFYGHCMKDRSMFGSLKDYKDEEFYLENPIIEYDTLYEKYEYEIISVFVGEAYYDEIPDGTFVYYNCINFTTQDEFDYFYNNIKEKSMYNTGVDAQYGDKFITLSTCSYEFANARTVIIAKKVN